MDEIDFVDIKQLVQSGDRLAQRSAVLQQNMNYKAARLQILLEQIDARQEEVAALQAKVDRQQEDVIQFMHWLDQLNTARHQSVSDEGHRKERSRKEKV